MSNYPFPILFCSIGLRGKPVAEALDQIAAAGFRGVEIWWPHLEKLDEEQLRGVAGQCKKLGLAPMVIAPYFSFTRGEEWRVRSIETARAALKADWTAAIAGLRELCDLDPGSEFVVETHENTLADSLPTIQRLFTAVDRPNLKLNFQINPDFLKRGYMECLEILYPLATHMHWDQLPDAGKATYIDEPGLVDFGQLIGWLVARGYRGTASVEYCWSPVDENRIPSAVRFLDGLMGKLDAR